MEEVKEEEAKKEEEVKERVGKGVVKGRTHVLETKGCLGGGVEEVWR